MHGWNAPGIDHDGLGVWIMNENLLNDLIKGLVTDEVIEKAVQNAVKERMDYFVGSAIEKRAKKIAEEYCDKRMTDVLDEIYSKPVIIDYGWQKPIEYESFEDFVKAYVGEKVNSSRNIIDEIRRMLSDRLDRYCKQVVEEQTKDLTNKVLKKVTEELE